MTKVTTRCNIQRHGGRGKTSNYKGYDGKRRCRRRRLWFKRLIATKRDWTVEKSRYHVGQPKNPRRPLWVVIRKYLTSKQRMISKTLKQLANGDMRLLVSMMKYYSTSTCTHINFWVSLYNRLWNKKNLGFSEVIVVFFSVPVSHIKLCVRKQRLYCVPSDFIFIFFLNTNTYRVSCSRTHAKISTVQQYIFTTQMQKR